MKRQESKLITPLGMSVILLPMLFTLICHNGFSQNQKIDSLKSLLPVKSGVAHINVLFELSLEYGDVNIEQSVTFANEAFKLSKTISDSLWIVKTGRIKSQLLRHQSRIDSSLILGTQILAIARRHRYIDEIKKLLNGLGLDYIYTAEYDRAFEYLFESLDLREKHGDEFEISVALHNLGVAYYKLKNYDKALLYFHLTLQKRIDGNYKDGLDLLYSNIALCYAYKNMFGEASSFASKALSVCDDNCSDYFLTNTKFCLGVIAFGQQNYFEAENQFLKSYELAIKLGEKRFQLDNIIYLLQIYVEQNQVELAEIYLKNAEILMTSGTPYNLELIKIYAELFSLYSNSKDFEKLAFYQNKYITLKDSIYNEELTTNLMKVEAEHLEKENQARIESQAKILALNEDVILHQKYMNVFIGLVVALLMALSFVLVRSNIQKRKNNHLLDDKVKERTQELEINRDALHRACEERDALIYRASTDIKSLLATIKGLCTLGLKEVKDPNAYDYLNKVDMTSDNFYRILDRFSR